MVSQEPKEMKSIRLKRAFSELPDFHEGALSQEGLECVFTQMPAPDAQEITPDVIKSFAWTEHLAHYTAYDALQRPDNAEIQILNEQGNIQKYRTEKTISDDKGMVFEVITPLEIDTENPVTLYILFTGTHSKETFLADWERAPGEECFRQNEIELIWKQLNHKIGIIKEETKQPVEIVCIGHSLGGSYAQLTFHALQRALMLNQHEKATDSKWLKEELAFRQTLRSRFLDVDQSIPLNVRNYLTLENIQGLTLGIWNSSGVISAVEANSCYLAKKLSTFGLKQRAFFGLIEGDYLQMIGKGTILRGVASTDADLHLVKFNRREDWVLKKAKHQLSTASTEANLGGLGLLASLYMDLRERMDSHSNPTLNPENMGDNKEDIESVEIKFEYYQNSTPQSTLKIYEKLNRSKILNTFIFQTGRVVVYNILRLWVKKSDRPKHL